MTLLYARWRFRLRGMVLTGPQDPEAHAELMRLTGLPLDQFEALDWADRHAYDEGKLTGLEFWRKTSGACIGLSAGLSGAGSLAEQLNLWDARMWTTENLEMLAWQLELKQRGVRTAILSNMGDNVLANMKREFDWLGRFDVLVWSYSVGYGQAWSAIYRHDAERAWNGTEETLFLDDKLVNIEAAQSLGIRAIQFSNVIKLAALT